MVRKNKINSDFKILKKLYPNLEELDDNEIESILHSNPEITEIIIKAFISCTIAGIIDLEITKLIK